MFSLYVRKIQLANMLSAETSTTQIIVGLSSKRKTWRTITV